MDLVKAVAEGAEVNQATAKAAVDTALDFIANHLKAGNEVRIIGHGTYSAPTREAHKGRNPITGEMIMVPSKRIPKFKMSTALKAAIA
jgi:DNA-binding protein HU-beta